MTSEYSVLLSLYIKEKPNYLRQSLDSIFNQTLVPSEVILVKDGPLTDELNIVVTEYVTKYKVLKVVSLNENQGLGKALNEGLKYCTYDLVARMDTDDIAKYDRFEKQMFIFDKFPEVDVVGAWIEEFENSVSNVLSIRKVPETHEAIHKFAQCRCPINHPVVMFRKKAVICAGGYQHFPLFEDYYLWMRMLMNGARFYNIQESLLFFRISSDMFKRRGGWKYACDELRFQNIMRKIGFISLSMFLRNVYCRFTMRVLPNMVRKLLYNKLLR